MMFKEYVLNKMMFKYENIEKLLNVLIEIDYKDYDESVKEIVINGVCDLAVKKAEKYTEKLTRGSFIKEQP